jgi:hypothetical protein
MPAREAGKTVDNLNKRQAYMTKYQFLGSCDRASWAKCEEKEETNKMQ